MDQRLADTEQQYLIQVLLKQPLGEALSVFLKLTGQKLVPAEPPPPLPSDKDV